MLLSKFCQNPRQLFKTIVEAKLLADPDLQVRLAAMLKLADISQALDSGLDKDAANALVQSLALADDKVSLDGWTSAAAMNAGAVLPALVDAANIDDSKLPRLEIVAEHFARSSPKSENFVEPVRRQGKSQDSIDRSGRSSKGMA